MTISQTIARVTPQGITTVYPMQSNSGIAYMTQGPDGNLWFTDEFRDEIGRIVLSNKSSQT
jgi:streptogramin lyase